MLVAIPRTYTRTLYCLSTIEEHVCVCVIPHAAVHIIVNMSCSFPIINYSTTNAAVTTRYIFVINSDLVLSQSHFLACVSRPLIV